MKMFVVVLLGRPGCFFLYDGSNFYDSQQGVGRVSVNYRNGLICWVWPPPSNSGK